MIGNIKKLFLPKTGMQNKQVLQDPGLCQRGQNCMLHAILQGCAKYPMLKESKEITNTHNTIDLRHSSLMLKESKSFQ